MLVNTCGFVDAAKKDSIDTVLAAADTGKKVVAVGCLAERYGDELADVAARGRRRARLRQLRRHRRAARRRRGRSPGHRARAARPPHAAAGHPGAPPGRVGRGRPARARLAARRARRARRLDDSPLAYLKLASGCDRRCTSAPSRPSAARSCRARRRTSSPRRAGSPSTGARELVLVSENSTSYGKDLGDLRALETLLPQLGAVDGIERIRVGYLQPAELRPALLEAIASTPGVAPYFDLSFQHASPTVLRRMKRFGSTEAFLEILDRRARRSSRRPGRASTSSSASRARPRTTWPSWSASSTAARLDVVGVFGYSDEDGTEAAKFDGKLVRGRDRRRGSSTISALVDELMAQRAEDRIGDDGRGARRGRRRRRGRRPRRRPRAAPGPGGRRGRPG